MMAIEMRPSARTQNSTGCSRELARAHVFMYIYTSGIRKKKGADCYRLEVKPPEKS